MSMIPCRLDGPTSLDRLRGAQYTARIAANFRPDPEERIAMSKGFLTSHGVIVAALSLSLVGCGQFGQLKASKHFKDANALYAQQDYRGAAAEYKSRHRSESEPERSLFLPGEQLRQPVQAGAEGQSAERQLPAGCAQELQDRVREAGRREAGDQAAAEAHAAVHGGALRQGQAESAGRSRAGRQAADCHGAHRHRKLLRAGPDLRGRRQDRGRRGDPEAGPGRRPRQGRRLVAVGPVLQPQGRVRSGHGVVPAHHPDRSEEPAELLPDGGVLRGEGPQGLHPQAAAGDATTWPRAWRPSTRLSSSGPTTSRP